MASHASDTTSHGLDPTLNPQLRSWVPGANDPEGDFPVQNLPLCTFLDPDGDDHPRVGMRVGECIVDLYALHEAGMLGGHGEGHAHDGEGHDHELCVALEGTDLAPMMDLPPARLRGLRAQVQQVLLEGAQHVGGQRARRVRQHAVRPVTELELLLPVERIGGYTDFYAGIHHATNVGSMFRPDNPLLPNYKHVPIGYHGRTSTIDVAGPVHRPSGQQAPPDADPKAGPSFGPCTMLDYELEVGLFVRGGNMPGQTISIQRAPEHMVGLVLLNDWSARDIQKWEYQPLGPFLAKNFATTISPYVVTMDALAPFRCGAFARPAGDPSPLSYLMDGEDQSMGGFDITLEALLQTRQMEAQGMAAQRLSIGTLRDMYWTFAQLLTHHASNGCALETGDLLGSGTISGASPGSRGSLLELTWAGTGPDGKPRPRTPIALPTGEQRTFLKDGDTVILRAWCQQEGFRRIGFGECAAMVVDG